MMTIRLALRPFVENRSFRIIACCLGWYQPARWFTVCGLVASFAFVGCGGKSNDSPAKAPRETNAGPIDDVRIPAGTPDELFKYVASLDEAELPADPEQRGIEVRRRMVSRVKASDAILAQEVAPESRATAVQMKLDALRTLELVDPEGFGKEFQPYVEGLIKGGDTFFSRLAQTAQFQSDVWSRIDAPEDPSREILDSLANLLKRPDACPSVFQGARDAVNRILPTSDEQVTAEQLERRVATAARAYRMIGERFHEFADQTVAHEARLLLVQSDDLYLKSLSNKASSGDVQSIRKLLEFVKDMLQAKKPHGDELAYVIQTAQFLEWEGRNQPALEVYEAAWRQFKDDHDQKKSELVRTTFDNAKRRLEMIEQPFSLTGVLHDGTRFDWSTYDGKHVIVCFWGTWFEGWKAEVESIRAALHKHANKDIKVVTVNLDDQAARDEFLAQNPLEWPIVVSPDPARVGQKEPNAARYGVEAVPFMLLVKPDGRVAKIHLMGPSLETALSEI